VRLATIRTGDGTEAIRIEGDRYAALGASDVGAVLESPDWRRDAEAAGAASTPLDGVEYAPLVPRPGKIVCVGLNYRAHILEMGRDLPQAPTLFAKYAESLIGATDPVALPPETEALDAPVRRASADEAGAAIAGFSVLNDVTTRDWQNRTKQWLQGKTFEGTTPLGPVLVTPDELPGGTAPALELSCTVDGEEVQKAGTDDLVFGPVELVRYISTILTLKPGDVIATGTPGGVGHARKPPRYLADGSQLVTEISGIGRLENVVRSES
jgi:acylpyruvate hydrolase